MNIKKFWCGIFFLLGLGFFVASTCLPVLAYGTQQGNTIVYKTFDYLTSVIQNDLFIVFVLFLVGASLLSFMADQRIVRMISEAITATALVFGFYLMGMMIYFYDHYFENGGVGGIGYQMGFFMYVVALSLFALALLVAVIYEFVPAKRTEPTAAKQN